MADVERERLRALRRQCTRQLHGHLERPPAEVLSEVAAYCREQPVDADRYGTGDFLGAFEKEIAGRLGFPAAAFMPTGTMEIDPEEAGDILRQLIER